MRRCFLEFLYCHPVGLAVYVFRSSELFSGNPFMCLGWSRPRQHLNYVNVYMSLVAHRTESRVLHILPRDSVSEDPTVEGTFNGALPVEWCDTPGSVRHEFALAGRQIPWGT